MTYNEFLTRIIDEGITAAIADYTEKSQKQKLEGSIAGFNACRNLSPEKLVDLWHVANADMNNAFLKDTENYWHYRSHQLEVEWVINVISAVMVNEGGIPLLSWLPTVNGMLKASTILGINSNPLTYVENSN